jgi:hypothetical protein
VGEMVSITSSVWTACDRRPAVRPVLQDPTTPTPQPLTGITQHRFSHHPLSFATTHGLCGCPVLRRDRLCLKEKFRVTQGNSSSFVCEHLIQTCGDPRRVRLAHSKRPHLSAVNC